MIDWAWIAFVRCPDHKCENCHNRPWTEKNHCVIHRSKKYEKWLYVPENIEFVCHECHDYPAHTHGHKVVFWMKQITRGYDMDKWWDNLPWVLKLGRSKPI
jgi:hypothetical protein